MDERSGSEATDAERRARVDELNAAAAEVRRTDYDRLRELADEAYRLASRVDAAGESYLVGMATALGHLAHRTCLLGEFELSLQQAHQGLALLEGLPPDATRCDLLDTIAWNDFYLGSYADALEFFLRALKVAEQIEDRAVEAHLHDGIGNVHSASGHAELALDSQQRALAIYRELDDRTGEAVCLNNLVYTYLDLERFGEAEAAAEKALRYADEDGKRYLHMAALDTLAQVHLRSGDLDTAEASARLALGEARACGSEPDESDALLNLARIAHLRGADDDEALTLAERALASAERSGRTVEVFECQELLAAIHEGRGEFEPALTRYKRFHELKEARFDDESASRLASLKVTHEVETARKDAEIQRLRSLALEREIEEHRVLQAKLEATASLDPLTGLFNRRHFDALAGETLRLAREDGRPVSLMMFDIDEFKQVNDTYGHAAGDRAIVAVARRLSDNARKSDVPCRFGGDEFVVLLSGADLTIARGVAERLRQTIATTPIQHGPRAISLTISVGVAGVLQDQPLDMKDLMERADAALYAAKQGGRDLVVVADGDDSTLPDSTRTA